MALAVEKKHQWGWYVEYKANNDQKRTLQGSVYSEQMVWVERYFRRKFTRVAKELVELTVWDEGMTSDEGLLCLREQPDGTIIASVAATGEEICRENPNGTRSSMTTLSSIPRPSMQPTMGYIYTPTPPLPVYPGLDTYKEAFDVVSLPTELHTYGGNAGFKAKFYDVFPREK